MIDVAWYVQYLGTLHHRATQYIIWFFLWLVGWLVRPLCSRHHMLRYVHPDAGLDPSINEYEMNKDMNELVNE